MVTKVIILYLPKPSANSIRRDLTIEVPTDEPMDAILMAAAQFKQQMPKAQAYCIGFVPEEKKT